MDSNHKQEIDIPSLRDWFKENKRNFPWRQNPTPYRVWVSEVMLQQTRAKVVIPYFERWMLRFPSVASLAQSSLEEVLKLWEGLGYYSRAKSLHEGAKYLMENFGGNFPKDPQILKQMKGLGNYTIGAILSFAFHQRAVAMDGNVSRVLSRLYCYEEEIDSQKSQNFLRKKMEALLPQKEPWVVMEAFIELGATICTRSPFCMLCPLKESCLSLQRGKTQILPLKRKAAETIELKRVVFIISHRDELLLQKHEGKKIMSGLYEFPYFEIELGANQFYPGVIEKKKDLRKVEHSFTRFKALLSPSLWIAREKKELPGYFWISKKELEHLPFSSGHRKILQEVMRNENFAH